MHVFGVASITALSFYAAFHQQVLIFYFLTILLLYMGLSFCLPGARNIPIHKKLMLVSWGEPSEGMILSKVTVRTEKVEEIIKNHPSKLTVTHFVIKAIGELLQKAPDINGRLSLGKFVPHQSVDVSIMTDIDQGQDLASFLIRNVNQKSVEEIAEEVRNKSREIKTEKGDKEHKKRMKSIKHLPAFIIGVVMQMAHFISFKLGISIPSLGLQKDPFGAACLTSLGMLNQEDVYVPMVRVTGHVFIVAVCKIQELPVVEDDKIVIGRVMNVNFTVDHRYVEGGSAKYFLPTFRRVFDHPQLYIHNQGQYPQFNSY